MPTGPGAPNPSGIPGFNAVAGLSQTTTGQSLAVLLPAWINEISTSTTNASFMLPPGYAGSRITVINDTANSITIYGWLPPNSSGAGDTIALHTSSSQVTSSTGVAQAANTIADYVCFVGEAGNTGNTTAAQWKQLLTA